MLLLKASHKEQRSVIHFCGQKDCPNAIHSEMCPVYGNKCFTRPVTHVWCKMFAHWRKVFLLKKDLADKLFR